jgi:uncharacterized protein (DUF362 family)
MERIVVVIDLSRKYYDVSWLEPGGDVLLAHRPLANTPPAAASCTRPSAVSSISTISPAPRAPP